MNVAASLEATADNLSQTSKTTRSFRILGGQNMSAIETWYVFLLLFCISWQHIALIGLNSLPLWTSRMLIRKHHQSLHPKWVKCPFWVIYTFNPTPPPPPPPLESGLQNFLVDPICHTLFPVYVKCDDFKHLCAPLAACLQSHVIEMQHN